MLSRVEIVNKLHFDRHISRIGQKAGTKMFLAEFQNNSVKRDHPFSTYGKFSVRTKWMIPLHRIILEFRKKHFCPGFLTNSRYMPIKM